MTARIVDPAVFGRVAVAMGGWSAEREISLRGGTAVLAALRRRGVDAHGVDLERGNVAMLAQFDRVFVALHGRGGEDGVIQGWLEAQHIPYTGSGVLGSAVAMDKLRTKRLWVGDGLPTPVFVPLRGEADFAGAVKEVGLPMIVKPVGEGSSIGMSKVARAEDLPAAWSEAARYDREVFAERWIAGAEYTASILDGVVLPLIRLETPRVFYDYEAKYTEGLTEHVCPADIPDEIKELCLDYALRAHRILGCKGTSRTDFRWDDEQGADGLYVLETNTQPGMTPLSLVPEQARQLGISYEELVEIIVREAL